MKLPVSPPGLDAHVFCHQNDAVIAPAEASPLESPARAILIVDDDAPFIEALRDKIQSLYPLLDVQTCTDPFQALLVLVLFVGMGRLIVRMSGN